MKVSRQGDFPAIALSACVLGLVICPYIYLAIGVLQGVEKISLFLIYIILFFSSLFLLWHYISKPANHSTSKAIIIIEIISWLLILSFLSFTTFFFLLPAISRVAVFFLYFLSASILCFPIIQIRTTALQQRMEKLPKPLSVSLLVIIFSLSGFFLIANYFVEFRFIGGPYSQSPG